MTLLKPHTRRGASLLLVHCNAAYDDRPNAYSRLETEIGGELARLLVFALSGFQGRRASSSP
jgi:hypothetical protein